MFSKITQGIHIQSWLLLFFFPVAGFQAVPESGTIAAGITLPLGLVYQQRINDICLAGKEFDPIL